MVESEFGDGVTGETTQTPPTYATGPESNPGHIGGRRILLPLFHPYSP